MEFQKFIVAFVDYGETNYRNDISMVVFEETYEETFETFEETCFARRIFLRRAWRISAIYLGDLRPESIDGCLHLHCL